MIAIIMIMLMMMMMAMPMRPMLHTICCDELMQQNVALTVAIMHCQLHQQQHPKNIFSVFFVTFFRSILK